ncbi:hypothetical protein DJ57_154 [Yersinia rochesterensis]|nr:hypothetical protein DJ57_154 [Yersinia rochesterensis]
MLPRLLGVGLDSVDMAVLLISRSHLLRDKDTFTAVFLRSPLSKIQGGYRSKSVAFQVWATWVCSPFGASFRAWMHWVLSMTTVQH